MTTSTQSTRVATGFAAYTRSFEDSGVPLLGHLVVYSVFENRITPDVLASWFAELELDTDFLPGPIRACDAFEKVTGRDGVRLTYELDNHSASAGSRRSATLMIRHVRRDDSGLVRHLVREVRDEARTQLDYDTHLAECLFRRAPSPHSPSGAGTLRIEPDHNRIATLPFREQDQVYTMLEKIDEVYRARCRYLTGDRLRTLVRSYVEHLDAVKVRDTGGVYFVHHGHADTLARLRQLVARMGSGSTLNRVPIPAQDEMREMIAEAFTRQAKDNLDRLARDIAKARESGASPKAIETLYRRFRSVQASAAQHSELLATTLTDTNTALETVKLQFGGLLNANAA
ncbi:DUF6744 family protein [Actinomadura sp. NPDC048955]|uniref:DUF6744 family protein n=1 Tax=Actinomadura sp. NPDC048955 TaxID=3158228 RepID=UPI0033D7868E